MAACCLATPIWLLMEHHNMLARAIITSIISMRIKTMLTAMLKQHSMATLLGLLMLHAPRLIQWGPGPSTLIHHHLNEKSAHPVLPPDCTMISSLACSVSMDWQPSEPPPNYYPVRVSFMTVSFPVGLAAVLSNTNILALSVGLPLFSAPKSVQPLTK